MWFHVSCRFLFFQPLQDLGVKDFQAVKCPSGKKVTLDIFDHIFHFSLAFRISRTAEHGLEMLLVDKGTECSCQYEVTQVFSDQQENMGKFIGIDEILQGGTPNRPTHSTPKEGKKGEALARTSLEYPLELHRKVKKYAVDAGMKEKQVIAQAIREFFERVEKE